MEEKKRGRGRPRKLPHGEASHIRLVLINGEMERFRAACEAADMSQTDFSRAAVLHAVDVVMDVKPPTPKPARKAKKK